MSLEAPFPWFGGKSKVAQLVWSRFGDVPNYVEPFFGSGAVLLGRPHNPKIETVNDLDGFVANFWRSVRLKPEETAEWADYPVNENDLHARHVWLKERRESLRGLLEGDPEYCDPKIAGWWVWGQCQWIGSGWCGDSGSGPWQVVDTKLGRKLVHLGNAGRGVSRKLVHLGDAGRGVSRQIAPLYDWFDALSERLRNVRVCSGNWSRVCGPSATFKHGVTAVFLDPPYTREAGRNVNLYAEDSASVGHDVCRWAIENGSNPLLRIAVCGYEGEYEFPDSWHRVQWKANCGYGVQNHGTNDNSSKERIWFSPHCLTIDLFGNAP